MPVVRKRCCEDCEEMTKDQSIYKHIERLKTVPSQILSLTYRRKKTAFRLHIHLIETRKTLRFKGTVSRKITGVKSGINR